MIVLCVTNCPSGLRGDLSKWLNEINTGVYVGRLNARVREELWERICSNIKSGQATMVYSTNNEQGYAFLTHNTTWIPVDYEGITLMKKPLFINDKKEVSFLQPGFSKAAKYEKTKHFCENKSCSSYVVLDIETTGIDYMRDRIIEIGMLRIEGSEITQKYQCLIHSGKSIPDYITKLTGITNEMIEKEGIQEEEAFEKIQEFIGNSLVVGYNVQFDLEFVQKLGERIGRKFIVKKTKDVMRLAKRKLDILENYKLETVASYFLLDLSDRHRALADCALTHGIYLELNKL